MTEAINDKWEFTPSEVDLVKAREFCLQEAATLLQNDEEATANDIVAIARIFEEYIFEGIIYTLEVNEAPDLGS